MHISVEFEPSRAPMKFRRRDDSSASGYGSYVVAHATMVFLSTEFYGLHCEPYYSRRMFLQCNHNGRDYFTERNGTLENTEQLCKSSLHSLNYTNCIPLDRAATSSTTLVPFLLESLLLERIGSEFYEIAWAEARVWLTLAVTLTLTIMFRLPACRTRRTLSIGVQFVEIRHCSEDLHSRSVFSSVPFRSVK